MQREVQNGEDLPIDSLKTFLSDKNLIKDSTHDLNIWQYSNGYSNLTYLLKIGEKEFVLRRPPKGAVKRGHDMSREYKVLSQLERGYSQSPKVYAYCDDIDVIGSSFYVMEKIDGIILTYKEAQKRDISALEFQAISNCWLDSFVKLHAVDYLELGLGDLGKPDGYVERQVRNWGKQYIQAATMEIPEAALLMKWMYENQPKEYDSTFIHNDFKYDNVVFENDSWNKISAVLDWEMATLGDPLMDLGTSIAYWTLPSDGHASKIILSPTLMNGNPSRSDIVELYAQKSKRPINNIVFYYAFGLFKIAVIVQQIYYRYNKGLTSNEKFSKLDQACKLFCQMAWQAVQKKKIENFM